MTDNNLILLTPGPVMVSPRVRQALAAAAFSHRDPAFARLLADVQTGIADLAAARCHDVIVLAAGATAAIEGAFATLLSRKETLLVVSNGAFGERLAEIAVILGLPLRQVRYSWGQPVVLDEIEAVLDSDPAITSVALVHHDTSVGILNPVREIGSIAAARGLRFFVDVVSSFGAEEFDVEDAHAAVVIGSSNKCLESVAGSSFVLVRRDAWRSDVTPRTLYLDLRRYRSSSPDDPAIPFTPAVPAVAALREALLELAEEGGPAARHHRYQARNTQVRSGFHRHGIQPYFREHIRACSLTVATLPAGHGSSSWYAALRRRGFLVYEAKGVLRERCFLTANMGYLSAATIDEFLDAVGGAIQSRSAAV